jgi:cytidylate kinase
MRGASTHFDGSSNSLHALVACVRASAAERGAADTGRAAPAPFVTISRQCGAGGKTLAERLVEVLNAQPGDAVHLWTSWDRELVEKVASDHHISQEFIETVTETGRTWLDRLATDFATVVDRGQPDELTIYRRVASTVRALAEAGYVVIVGRGGMRITRDLPGGLHLRLVAPLEHRIEEIARRRGLSIREARGYVRSVDRGRAQFYQRFFRGITLAPEQFSVTFNTAAVTEEQIVEGVVPMLAGMRVPPALGRPTGRP